MNISQIIHKFRQWWPWCSNCDNCYLFSIYYLKSILPENFFLFNHLIYFQLIWKNKLICLILHKKIQSIKTSMQRCCCDIKEVPHYHFILSISKCCKFTFTMNCLFPLYSFTWISQFTLNINLSITVSNVKCLFCWFVANWTKTLKDFLVHIKFSVSFYNPHIFSKCLAFFCFTFSLQVKARSSNSVFGSGTIRLYFNFVLTFKLIKFNTKCMSWKTKISTS
jgi:hypothetical protein